MTDSRWPRIYCVSAVLRVVHLFVVDEGPVRVKYACTVAILYICELASPLLRER